MPDIWVDPIFGSDGNTGLSPATAKATFNSGFQAVTAGATLHLMAGVYSDQVNNWIPNKSITVRGEGVVRIVATAGSGITTVLAPSFAPITPSDVLIRLEGLRFEGYQRILFQTDGPACHVYMKHCTFSNTVNPGGAGIFQCAPQFGFYAPYPSIRLENCTFRKGASRIFYAETGIHTNRVGFNVSYMRNNIFDDYTTFASIVKDYSASQVQIEISRSQNNAYSGISGGVFPVSLNTAASPATVNRDAPTETGSLYSHTPAYTNTGATPPDLSISPTSGSALLGGGDRGALIGSPFWPVRYSGSDPEVLSTDWANWSNDLRWYDTGLGAPGVDGPSDASPAILLSSEPRMWIIHPYQGQQKSARIIGPVWDTGTVATFKSLSWKAIEQGVANVVSNAQDYTSPSPGPQIEIRYSNTAFGRTDVSPTNWTLISKKQQPVITARYWQARIVLRTDAF